MKQVEEKMIILVLNDNLVRNRFKLNEFFAFWFLTLLDGRFDEIDVVFVFLLLDALGICVF